MTIRTLTMISLLIMSMAPLQAQQKVGINTTSPVRTLEVYGSDDQYLRVHSTSFAGSSGIELIRGLSNQDSPDWRIVNDAGNLRILSSEDNFVTGGMEAMRVNTQNNTGIGTITPAAKLHIDNGSQIAFGGYGYLRLGHQFAFSLAMDNHQLQAYNSLNPTILHLQPHGGNTYFGNSGGNTYMALGGGKVGVGLPLLTAGLNSLDEDFQLYIENSNNGANGWHIGATNSTWVAGGNQLIFSPTGSSNDAVLRLMNVSENDGVNAPVMIYSSYNHTLLLDGNEIDTRGTPLYINHNSDENTYLNANGGRVGIGTTNPQAKLHIDIDNMHPLVLQNSNAIWKIAPQSLSPESLFFDIDNLPMAHVHGYTGQWIHLSDARAKENITSLPMVSGDLDELNVYRYRMQRDPEGSMQIGIMAQEAAPLFSQMVYEQEGQYGIGYGQLAAVGVKAVQEQQEMIDLLEKKIRELRERTSSLHNPMHVE